MAERPILILLLFMHLLTSSLFSFSFPSLIDDEAGQRVSIGAFKGDTLILGNKTFRKFQIVTE